MFIKIDINLLFVKTLSIICFEQPALNMYFETLHSNDIDYVSLMIAEAFTQHEPLTKHIKVTQETFYKWCRQVIETSLIDKMCFVARNDNNVIVGCVIAEDARNTIAPDVDELRPILNLLDNIAEHCPLNINTCKTLHLYLAATKTGFEGQQICFRLIEHLLHQAKTNNYQYIVSELTAHGTQHICIKKLNFQNIYCVQYTDCNSFQGLEGQCILALKEV